MSVQETVWSFVVRSLPAVGSMVVRGQRCTLSRLSLLMASCFPTTRKQVRTCLIMNTISSAGPSNTSNKRKRLSTACDRCRQRKIKCDDALPVCTNCLRGDAECVTRDLRQPHIQAQRTEARGSRKKRVGRQTTSPRVNGSDLRVLHDAASFEDQASAQAIGSLRHPTCQTSRRYSTPQHRPADASVSDTIDAVALPDVDDTDSLMAGPLPSIPRFGSGNSLLVLTQWLDLAFARLNLADRFSWQYRINPRRPHSRISNRPRNQHDWGLSWSDTDKESLDRYMATVNQVFPMINPRHSRTMAPRSLNADCDIEDLFYFTATAVGSPLAYFASESSQCLHIVDLALSRILDLMQSESIYAVGTLILLSLLFRARDESDMAWHMLSNAVARAQAIGLDRRIPFSRKADVEKIRDQRINMWWSLFILDKILAVEVQRPPMIRHCLYDQEMPLQNAQGQVQESLQSCFLAMIALSKIQERVSGSLLECSQAESSGRTTIDWAINEKIRISGELDQLLRSWVDRLPYDLKPSEYPSCDSEVLPAVSFLALQYYQTYVLICHVEMVYALLTLLSLFLIHRNALVISAQAIKARVDLHYSSATWRHRILKGASLCGSIARSMVDVLDKLSEYHAYSILNSIYAPLISIYTLAIVIVKAPSSESARIDLEIQASAIRMLERLHPMEATSAPSVYSVIKALHSRVARRVSDRTNVSPFTTREASAPARSAVDINVPDSLHLSLCVTGSFPESTDPETYTRGDTRSPGQDTTLPYDFFDLPLDLDGMNLDAFAQAFDLPS
ncbi:hypothetical protein E4T42_04616 [Aureobasidium subglaciale]|nr:hypothetical protein E4T42_04616 [Aureobasidium subglaciale]